MKKVFAIVAIVACALACEPEVQNYVKLADAEQEATLAFGVKGGEKTVVIATDAAWTATADQTWLTVEPASGAAGEAVELTVSVPAENTSYDNLSATITIAAGNAAPLQIAVTQSQTDEVNVGELEALNIGYEGGEVELPVNANIEYEITSDADWAVVEGTRGLTTTKHVIKVAKNGTAANRTATITLEAEGFEPIDVYLTQAGYIFSVNSTTVIPQVGSVTITDGSTAGGVVSVALFDGKLVVCAGDGSMPKLVNKATGAVEGDLVTGGFVPYYVANDDAGNLVMTTRVHNNVWDGNYSFQVWYLTPGSTTAVKLVQATAANRHNGCGLAVRGDVTKNAAILVPEENPYWAGTSAVAGWDVVNGVVGEVQNFMLTGFDGMLENFQAPNYWSGAPNNFSSFALMGPSVASGAIMFATYPDNGIYTVAGAECSLVVSLVVDTNHAANAIDMISVGDKAYVAVSGATYFTWSVTEAKVFCVEGTTITPVATISCPVNCETYSGATSDVCLEAVEGGLNIYCLNNATASLEAYFLAL